MAPAGVHPPAWAAFLGHFPAQRRLLVADLLRGQGLRPAPAPAVQPQALMPSCRGCGRVDTNCILGALFPRSGRPGRRRTFSRRLPLAGAGQLHLQPVGANSPLRRRSPPSAARAASQWPPEPCPPAGTDGAPGPGAVPPPRGGPTARGPLGVGGLTLKSPTAQGPKPGARFLSVG